MEKTKVFLAIFNFKTIQHFSNLRIPGKTMVFVAMLNIKNSVFFHVCCNFKACCTFSEKVQQAWKKTRDFQRKSNVFVVCNEKIWQPQLLMQNPSDFRREAPIKFLWFAMRKHGKPN